MDDEPMDDEQNSRDELWTKPVLSFVFNRLRELTGRYELPAAGAWHKSGESAKRAAAVQTIYAELQQRVPEAFGVLRFPTAAEIMDMVNQTAPLFTKEHPVPGVLPLS